MKFLSKVPKPWRGIIITVAVVILVPIILFIGLVIYRMPAAFERQDTEEAIKFIQSQKLTMEDVMGENLPPVPDPALVDATVEGIDANNNLIRDDVELAIFEKYPDDAVIRSAMLQYAMGLQMELTQVFNSETWVAAVEESGRGSGCVGDTVPSEFSIPDFDTSEEHWEWVFANEEELEEEFERRDAIIDARESGVDALTYNTDLRTKRKDEVIQFIYGFGSSDKPEDCDIDPAAFIKDLE